MAQQFLVIRNDGDVGNSMHQESSNLGCVIKITQANTVHSRKELYLQASSPGSSSGRICHEYEQLHPYLISAKVKGIKRVHRPAAE